MSTQTQQNPTVVLVHAAWADGSSWAKVIAGLRRVGITTQSVQLPLTSLSEDAAAVRRTLGRLGGPAIVVGHSYGGAPMTVAATGVSEVKGLVYVAAMAPDESETVGELLHRAPPHPMSAKLAPDSDGYIWMSAEGFANSVAPKATSDEIALMTAVQKPIAMRCLGQPAAKPAWREKPSWFLLAEEDRQILPDTQRFMAERMNARVDAQNVDHSPNLTAPEAVVTLIRRAMQESGYMRADREEIALTPVEIVRSFYDALKRGDIPALVALLSDDIAWTEAESFPYFSGTWRRPEDVVEKLLVPLSTEWADFSADAESFVSEAKNVVAFGAYRGLNRTTGRRLLAPFAHRWCVSDGRISSFTQYTDTLLVKRVMAS